MHNDPAVRRLLNPQLQSGEWVLWSGKPLPLRMAFHEGEAMTVAIFALAMIVTILLVYPSTHIFAFNLLGLGLGVQWILLLFAVVALYSFAKPVYQYWAATQTIYAVTDRRALSLKPTLNGRIVQSYTHIQHIQRRDLPEDRGDLIFGSANTISNHLRYGLRVRRREIGFFGIDNAREVEQIMLHRMTGMAGMDADETL